MLYQGKARQALPPIGKWKHLRWVTRLRLVVTLLGICLRNVSSSTVGFWVPPERIQCVYIYIKINFNVSPPYFPVSLIAVHHRNCVPFFLLVVHPCLISNSVYVFVCLPFLHLSI